MCQTILFDLFLVVQMCKELNRLEHMVYLGVGDEVINVCGLSFENNLHLKVMTKASIFYKFSKGRDLGFWKGG